MARPPHQRDPDSTVAVGPAVDATGETLAATGGEPPRSDSLADSFRRGAKLESFMVLEELGRGGMGVVVSAYDPQLDRKVAIKVLKPGVFGAEASGPARARLLREAQAMAKLSHPHVITVYEVGQHADQIFVVMEFVDGQTLKGWWREQPRTCRQILDAFVQAGEGLAAAHRAGLVHRDFKPDNVLVDRAGHVRVTDFGLAGSAAAAVAAAAPGDLPTSTPFAITLTHDGQLLGTPAYMAPEQHERKHVDAKADQFAYCVALHEALYGQRPFVETGGLAALSDAVRGNERRELPRDHGVPTWVHKILERGLAIDPADRYPSMDALLDDLRRDPAARRRRVAAFTGALLLVAGTAAGIAYTATDRPALCTGARARLAGIWDAGVKASVKKAFEATGIPHAPATYARVESVLDAYAADWIAMRTEACEATHVRGDQSAALLDLRMECLDRRAGALGALTRLLATEASEEVVSEAVQAAYAIEPVSVCADRDALVARVPMPSDPRARNRILALRHRLEDVDALTAAGQYPRALDHALSLKRDVSGLDYAPLEAEVSYALGVLEMHNAHPREAESALLEAAELAARGRDDALLGMALSRLVFVVGYQQSRFDIALTYGQAGELAVVRLGRNPAVAGQLASDVAIVHRAKGDLELARSEFETALELFQEAYGARHPKIVKVHLNLANTHRDLGEHDEAKRVFERALDILSETVGPDHPEVAQALSGYAAVLDATGDQEQALALRTRALEIRERALGTNHPYVAASLNSLGVSWRNRGDLDRAEDYFRRAITVWESTLGPDFPNVASALTNLGNVMRLRKRYEEAIAYHQRALDILERSYGPDHIRLVIALENMAVTYRERGDYASARAYYERSLRIRMDRDGPTHPLVARTLRRLAEVASRDRRFAEAIDYCRRALEIDGPKDSAATAEDWLCLGAAEARLGRRKHATDHLERALEVAERAGLTGPERGDLLFEVAKVLALLGAEQRAVELTHQARAAYAHAGLETATEVGEMDAWLTSR